MTRLQMCSKLNLENVIASLNQVSSKSHYHHIVARYTLQSYVKILDMKIRRDIFYNIIPHSVIDHIHIYEVKF